MAEDTPLHDAIAKPIPASLHAELGVVGSQRDGVGLAGGISGYVGKGVSLDAEGQIHQKSGWKFSTVVRWTKGK
jgi:hypothetical protein